MRIEMVTTAVGRPRDAAIDEAVMRATIELLERDGYLQLTIANVAERAGTSKPAVYRRWPTKAHLVHEAVFPAQDFDDVQPTVADPEAIVRTLVMVAVDLLGRPAARAALPGLLAETASDHALAADVLARAAGGTFVWLHECLEAAVAAKRIRRGVSPFTVFELAAGAAFIATATRDAADLGAEWMQEVVAVIVRGIAP